jgi:hypothetical protein
MLKLLFLDKTGKSILGNLLETALVGTGTKAIGSLSRIQYGKNDPDEVRESTVRREGVLLGLTFPFTLLADWVSVKGVLPALQKHFNLSDQLLANRKKLLMLPPAVAGIVGAELIANLVSRKPDWKMAACKAQAKRDDDDDDDDDRRQVFRVPGGRLNLTLDPDACQFRGAPSPAFSNVPAAPFGNAAYPSTPKAALAGFPPVRMAGYPTAASSGFRV